jgi:hypothetical protein
VKKVRIVCCSVDAVYAMAHSLHNLVLDLCCNNTHLFTSPEEALQVMVELSFPI